MSDNADLTFSAPDAKMNERLSSAFNLLVLIATNKLSSSETFCTVVQQIQSQFGFAFASIYLIDPDKKKAALFSSEGANNRGANIILNDKSPIFDCLSKQKNIQTKRIILHTDDPRSDLLTKYKSCLFTPLFVTPNNSAVLEIFTPLPQGIAQAETAFMEQFAPLLGTVLQAKITTTSIMQNNDRIHRMLNIVDDLESEPSPDNIIRRTVVTLSVLFPGTRIAFLTPESRGKLRVRSYTGYADSDVNTLRLRPGGIIDKSAFDQIGVHVSDLSKHKSGEGLSSDSQSVIAVPVLFGRSLIGFINLENTQTAAFSEADFDLILLLSRIIAPYLIELKKETPQPEDSQKQVLEFSNMVNQANDLESILRISAEEIGRSLNLTRTTLRVDQSALRQIANKNNLER